MTAGRGPRESDAMITRLQLSNWKSFGEGAEIYFDPLTLMIGANDSGKSNLVEALWFLGQLPRALSVEGIITGEAGRRYFRGGSIDIVRRGAEVARLSVEISDEAAGTFAYDVSVTHVGGTLRIVGEALRYSPESSVHPGRMVFETKPGEYTGALVTTIWEGGRDRPKDYPLDRSRSVLAQMALGTFPASIASVVAVVARNLGAVVVLDPQPVLMRQHSRLAENLHEDGSNLAGYIAQLPIDRRAELEARTSALLAEVLEGNIAAVTAEPIPPIGADGQLLAQPRTKQTLPPIDGRLLSDGTLRFVAVATAVLTSPSGSLLVLDEVDTGLHASKVRLLADFLKSSAAERGIDLLITSHNSAFLNALGPEIAEFTYVVHRKGDDLQSTVSYLYESPGLVRLIAGGGIGSGVVRGNLPATLATS